MPRRLWRRGRVGLTMTTVLAVGSLVCAACIFTGSWTAQPIASAQVQVPNPTNLLDDVDCVSATACLAVGPSQAATWNGTTWSLVTPPGTDLVGLVGVSCRTATSCLVATRTTVWSWVGSSWTPISWPVADTVSAVSCGSTTSCVIIGYRTATPAFVAERWNGSTLADITPTSSTFFGADISCTSSTWCLAVGFTSSAPAAWMWNGTGWTATVLPATLHTAMDQVDCSSPSWCGGIIDAATGTQSATWNGTSWTASAYTPIDEASGQFGYVDIACDATSSCFAFTQGASIAHLGGAQTPWPDGGSAIDISCWAAGGCAVVGRTQSDPIAGHLSGSSWSTDPFALATHPDSTIDGLSCPSTTFCMAVGSSPVTPSMVETWNGSTWASGAVPAEPDPKVEGIQGNDVTCLSANFCVLAEDFVTTAFGDEVDRLSTWNGTAWTTTQVAGFGGAVLKVACATTTRCLAVGEGVAWSWNGTAWAETDPPGSSQPGDVQATSCASATSCVSVSGLVRATLPSVTSAIHSWNGSSWTFIDAPAPAGQVAMLTGVSCVATLCAAVGAVGVAGSSTMTPYVLEKHGSGPWTATPTTLNDPGTLRSVSCPTDQECVAVGSITGGSPPSTVRLGLGKIGTIWGRTVDLPPADVGPTTYGLVSCVAEWCQAVGQATPTLGTTPVSATYTWTG